MIFSEEIFLRLPSVLFYILAVLVMQATLLLFLSPRLAFWGSLFFASSSFVLNYAQEARLYSLVLFLAALANYCLLNIALPSHAHNSQKTKFFWGGYFFSFLLSLYTFYYTAFLFLSHVIFALLAVCYERKKKLPALWQKHFVKIVAVQFTASLLFLPWAYWAIPIKLKLFAEFTDTQSAKFSGSSLSQLGCDFLFPEFLFPGKFFLMLILACGIFCGGFYFLRNKKIVSLLLIFSLIFPIVILVFFPFQGHQFESKHLIFLLPGFYLLAVLAIFSLQEFPRAHKFCLALFGIIIAINFAIFIKARDQEKQNWRKAVEFVHENLQEGSIVCFNPFYLKEPFAFYYQPMGLHNKRFTPGFTYVAGAENPESVLPSRKIGYYLMNEQDFTRLPKKILWAIEIENCSVALPESRIHLWCKKYYSLQRKESFYGTKGTIFIYCYYPS